MLLALQGVLDYPAEDYNMEDFPSISETQSGESVEKLSNSDARRKRKISHALDGVLIEERDSYIKRETLVAEAIDIAQQDGILVISSAPGTGKTSLQQLIKKELEQKQNCEAYFLNPSSKRKNADFDLFDYVAKKTGVNFDESTLDERLKRYSEVYLLFDEGHKYYGEKFEEFWTCVVKQRTQGFGCETKIVVIVSATYYLTAANSDSPVVFKSCRRMGMEKLLFNENETSELFALRSPEPGWTRYKDVLHHFTNGTAALFAMGINLIVEKVQDVDHRADSQTEYTEDDLLEILVESNHFIEKLGRCYGSMKVDAAAHKVIFDAVVATYEIGTGEEAKFGNDGVGNVGDDDEPILRMRKVGILLNNRRFASPAAARYYFSAIFPRASRSTVAPENLEKLVIKVVESMSSTRLRTSRQRNKSGDLQSPKEAVFQHLFHERMYALLSPTYRIIAEFGTEAEVDGEVKTGELDFYIKNGNKWAIELLRDGDKVGAHLGRIGKKYKSVPADEWLVVDCRFTKPRKRDINLCSLVFSADCRSCECLMRSMQPFTLNLKE
jgi:hypothetical protein